MDFWFFLKIFWRGSPPSTRQLYFLTIKPLSYHLSTIFPSSSHTYSHLILIPLHPQSTHPIFILIPPHSTHINLYKVLITPIILHIFTLLSTQFPYFISIFLSQFSISPLPQLIYLYIISQYFPESLYSIILSPINYTDYFPIFPK